MKPYIAIVLPYPYPVAKKRPRKGLRAFFIWAGARGKYDKQEHIKWEGVLPMFIFTVSFAATLAVLLTVHAYHERTARKYD